MQSYDRRAFMAYFSSIGLGATLLPGVLWAQMQQQQAPEITKEMVAAAEQLSGVSFTDAQREQIAQGLRGTRTAIQALHQISLDNSVPPAIIFDPLPPGAKLPAKKKQPMARAHVPVMARPGSVDELAYRTVAELSELVRTRKVKPSELTEMYLSRLKRYDPQLHCVISLTEERARAQAKDMDAEIARGKYRGPLHGIPWGAKDLLATKGYKTTWGASPYRNQVIDSDAEVVKRLDSAGAILVAKLTLGALAQGDIWYGERTRNPWNTDRGSSGSSAGPASATSAGLVGFSIGTETQGSISSPSTECGVTGLRPTFGRVPRTGAMALSWTMDKIGPICRSAEDCALVFDAIIGPDGYDLTIKDYPFNWNAALKPSQLRVGYFKAGFEPQQSGRGPQQPRASDLATLEVLKGLGVKLIPLELPAFPLQSSLVLNPESGAAFEEATLAGRLDEMERGRTDFPSTWPGTFRAAQFVPAVDYINANRARTLLCQKWWELFKDVDVIVSSTGGGQLTATNLTGTPAVIVPNGFRDPAAQPAPAPAPVAAGDSTRRNQPPTQPPAAGPTGQSITFLGALFQEEKALAVAHAYQQATDFHKKHPPQFA